MTLHELIKDLQQFEHEGWGNAEVFADCEPIVLLDPDSDYDERVFDATPVTDISGFATRGATAEITIHRQETWRRREELLKLGLVEPETKTPPILGEASQLRTLLQRLQNANCEQCEHAQQVGCAMYPEGRPSACQEVFTALGEAK